MTEENKDPVLLAGSHPLPYVQIGMLLRRTYNRNVQRSTDVEIWRVTDIFENSADKTIIVMKEIRGRFFDKDLPSAYVRENFELAEPFDPNRYK